MTISRILGAVLVAACALGAVAQEQVRRARVVTGVEIDGDLAEWRQIEPAFVIDRAEQAWNPAGDADWRGVDDLSAEVWLGCDRAHVYVAGRVRDDSFVGGGLERSWHQQDAIEVFFDPRADRSEPSIEEMIQLFVMPFSTERRWGRIDWRSNRPTGSTLVGVRAATSCGDGEYAFELVVPLCNFPAVAGTPSQIGFDLAIDDRDANSSRYQYMTMTGGNPVRNQRTGGRLEIDVAGARAAVPSDGAAWRWVGDNLTLLLIPLVALWIAWVALRSSRVDDSRWSRIRVWLRVGGLLVCVLGLLLPEWLVERRHEHHDARLHGVVGALQSRLDALGAGVLGSYGGEERDRAFTTLLDGGRISRERQYSCTNLRDIAGSGVTPARHHAALNVTVLPYGIPLVEGAVERFEFRTPLEAGHLNVTVARPIEEPAFGEEVEVYGTTVTLVTSGGEARPMVLDFGDAFSFYPSDGIAAVGTEVAMRTIELDRAVQAIVLSDPRGRGLELVGMTWASPDRIRERPLELGEPSLGGIETGLRGPWPRAAGIELGEGQRHAIDLPESGADGTFDRIWLFYCATYPGRPTLLRPGDTVCELRLWERGGEARLIEFRHQESMFFELELQNQEPPADGDTRTALRWKDEQQEAHVNFVRSFDLDAQIARIELRNVGQYPVRFRSIVFGREVRSVTLKPENSPLRYDETGREFLDPSFLGELRDAHVAVFRGGRLTAATSGDPGVTGLLDLPADVRRVALDEPYYDRWRADEGTVAYRAFSLLGGDWGGAVLGVLLRDQGFGSHAQAVHRVGVVTVVCAAPILLLLVGSALSLLGNLRLRLIVAVGAVMLVPLGMLSIVLIGVLEGAYEDELRERLAASVASARASLDSEQEALRTSSQAWVQDLAEQFGAAIASSDVDAAIRTTLASQRPPAWGEDGGFLLFEFRPDPARVDAPEARRVFLGPDDLRELDTPLRSDPGLYVAWSVAILGVRADAQLPFGSCSLSVGRRLGADFLGGIAREGGEVLLCGTNGYVLDLGPQARRRVDPAEVRERAEAGLAVQETGEPVMRHFERDGEPRVAMYDVLRDLQQTPRALLGIVEPTAGATLPLSIGQVPVRTFFVVVGALLVLSSLFLGWIMTTRISRPIEELERGARELMHGDFDVHIATEERGQIGRLTRTFNQMSDELRGRIEDLHVLNRGIRDLTSRLQPAEVVAHAVAFYTRNTPADLVRVLLRDRVREIAELHGGRHVEEIDVEDAAVCEVLAGSGPFSMRLADVGGAAFAATVPSARSALVLPLAVAGRNHGGVLLLFQTATPPQIDLELHATMAVQITAALENAWLYRTAVEDLHTGAFRPEYFASRVARAVREAQGRDGGVSLVGFRLTDGVAIAESLGQERHGRFLGRLCAIVRRVFGPDAELCRVADDELRVMIVDAERAALDEAVREVESRVSATEFDLPEPIPTVRLSSGFCRYPDDAASSEFLADVLETRLSRGMPSVADERRSPRHTPLGGKFVDSPAMNAVFRTIERFAPTDISLLLEGETGVGKEMLTDLIHAWSKRAAQPLVKVHCAALPEGLLQSELFGHEKGAFTGAHERNIGRFEQADGGTIFLDEIGEISLEVQVQLLRVLQEREIERVGGGRPIPVDVRVIAATNRNLRDMVAAGAFREDLYYRLQGMVIRVPPLRERRSEIPELIEHFRAESVAVGQTNVRGFAPDAMDELFRRPWPGNIRELRNTVLRAMVLADGELVTRADLGGAGGDAVIGSSPPVHVSELDRTPRAGREMPPVVIPAVDPAANEQRLARTLEWVRERGEVSAREVADAIGVSARTALRDLARLQAEGRLERVGKRRGARYRVANSAGRA